MNPLEHPFCRRLMVSLLSATLCSGQLVQFRGPDSGLVYDPPTQSLRRIAGLIGAARMGDAIVQEVEWASIAPNGKTALYRKGGKILALTTAGQVKEAPVPQVADPEEVFWGAGSQTALLVWTRAKLAQKLEIDVAGAITSDGVQTLELDGEITAVTGASDGRIFAAVAGRGVYVVDAGKGTSRMLLPMASCPALSTSGDGSELWAVDGERGVLYRIGMGDEQPAVVTTDPERLTGVSRMAMSSNHIDLLLANPKTRTLYLYGASSRSLTEVAALEAPVTQLRPLGRETLFLLSLRTTKTETVQLYDDARGDVYFVPFVGGEQ